jgi:predicted dehydrogenase
MTPRILIVGLGSIGSRHVDTLLKMGYTDLLGLEPRLMPDDDRLPIVQRWEDVEWWKPTHALICTPPDTHSSHALFCMRRGLHVFIEKPMTKFVYEAPNICEIAKAYGVTLAVGYMERANPTVVEARQFANANPIKNAYVECYWKQAGKTYAQNVVAESSHAIDTARFILGDLRHDATARTDSSAEMRLNGKDLNCYVTINADALPMRRINLYAHNGKAFGRQYGLNREEWDLCYQVELQAFLDGKPLCTGSDGLKVMEILEQVK